MKKILILALVLAVAVASDGCWKMVNTPCGTEERQVFVRYDEGEEKCVKEQYESGEYIWKKVCYHIGDVWCESKMPEWANFCSGKCCYVDVPEADKPFCNERCNCGFKQVCSKQQFPVMAYKDVCKKEQIPVYETQTFQKNCQTQVPVECDNNQKHQCGEDKEKYCCGTDKEQYQCGTESKLVQDGVKWEDKFICYEYKYEQCGQEERQFFSHYEESNPHECEQQEQYPCENEFETREVCVNKDVWTCNPMNEWKDNGWCETECCSNEIVGDKKALCDSRCACYYHTYKTECRNEQFPKMCYRTITTTCYDQTPIFNTQVFPKWCNNKYPVYDKVQVPNMVAKDFPIYCWKNIKKWCWKSVPKYCWGNGDVPNPNPAPPQTGDVQVLGIWATVPGMLDWCVTTCAAGHPVYDRCAC